MFSMRASVSLVVSELKDLSFSGWASFFTWGWGGRWGEGGEAGCAKHENTPRHLGTKALDGVLLEGIKVLQLLNFGGQHLDGLLVDFRAVLLLVALDLVVPPRRAGCWGRAAAGEREARLGGGRGARTAGMAREQLRQV
jgi:hypothetical protein